jgi:hypothetical protein
MPNTYRLETLPEKINGNVWSFKTTTSDAVDPVYWAFDSDTGSHRLNPIKSKRIEWCWV